MKISIGIIFMMAVFACWLNGEDFVNNHEPSWVLMEKGKAALDAKELGLAMEYFKKVVEMEGTAPEAEMWIGYIFEAEGNFELAEAQYKKAENEQKDFYVADTKYEILYRLARMYKNSNKWGKYASYLEQITLDDPNFQNSTLLTALLDKFERFGLDKMINLYRLDGAFSIQAHLDLGVYQYQRGNETVAFNHLILATLYIFTDMIAELRSIDPDYEFNPGDDGVVRPDDLYVFDRTANCLNLALGNGRLRDYIKKMELFKCLYYLGADLYEMDRLNQAQGVWRLIAPEIDVDRVWAVKAKKQLQKPFRELLDLKKLDSSGE